MPKPRRPIAESAESLAAVAMLATRWIERLLAGAEPPLTVSQFLALRAITREDLAATELARRAAVSGPAVSQLLASLVDAGLIERTAAAVDRRRQTLALTPAGEAAFLAAKEVARRELAGLLEELPRPEVDALARGLPVLEALLSGQPPPPRKPPPPKHRPGKRKPPHPGPGPGPK
jgi:DNA-binding MarR family transcriptional regulator